MINTNRIVPVTKTDLISLYALIVNTKVDNVIALQPDTVDGQFTIDNDSSGDILIASQPLKSCNITDTQAVIMFVPDYDYAGFTVDGAAATVDGDVVVPDGVSLYSAELLEGTLTITKISF